jgi:hypothetical protein
MRNLGIAVGMVLAAAIAYTHGHSIVWTIIDGVLGWIYVVYFLVTHYHLLGV